MAVCQGRVQANPSRRTNVNAVPWSLSNALKNIQNSIRQHLTAPDGTNGPADLRWTPPDGTTSVTGNTSVPELQKPVCRRELAAGSILVRLREE
jgi:hypothetical protein